MNLLLLKSHGFLLPIVSCLRFCTFSLRSSQPVDIARALFTFSSGRSRIGGRRRREKKKKKKGRKKRNDNRTITERAWWRCRRRRRRQRPRRRRRRRWRGEASSSRDTHTRGGGVCGRYGRTKGLFAPLGGLERLLHPTTLPILHRACASKAAHTTLLSRPAPTLHLLEELPPPRGGYTSICRIRGSPPPPPLRGKRETAPLSLALHPNNTTLPLSPSLSFFSLSPFRFLELLLFFFLFVLVVAQPRLGHFHHGNEDRAEEIFDFQRSSRSSLHTRKLEIARSLLLSGLLEIAGGWVFVLRIWIGREGERSRGRGILNRW